MTQRYANKRSVKNSSESILLADETFTGRWEDCSSYDTISFAVKTDVTGILRAQFTSKPEDDTIDSSLTYKIGTFNEVHRLTVTRQFFRLVYINDSVDQTYMSLDCMIGSHPLLSAPMNLSLGLDADAIAVRPTNFADEVAVGRRPGITPFTKFGYREGLTAGGGEETIWATTGNFTPQSTASTYTITYNNTTDGLGTTGALNIYITYLDANGIATIGIHTLGNTGSDTTSFSGLGINRAVVGSSGSANMNVNAITIIDGGTTQAVITAGASVTQQCIYHVASDAKAIAKFIWIEANKLSGGGSPRVLVKGYVYSRISETTYEIFRTTLDTSTTTMMSINEPVGFALGSSDILYFVADTDTNNTTVTMRFSLLEYDNE